MARGQRRSTRTSAAAAGSKPKSPENSPLSTRSNTPDVTSGHPSVNDESLDCPACTPESREHNYRKESWIECDSCKTWYHWRCAGNGEDVNNIAKWYCQPCIGADQTRQITVKTPARKSSRKKTQRDYANLNSGLGSDPNRWMRLLEGKEIRDAPFKRMEGSEINLEWLEDDDEAMLAPIIIERPEGLGMKMPPKDFTVDDVADLIGESTPLEVIDVASQTTAQGWTLGKWADYFEMEPSKREKIFNVISLEVSGTKISDLVLPPKFVRDLDWVENFWPSTRKGSHMYPKVQLYCLMGVARAWTDWHIDFAGSSVYYHILQGSKVFYFIKPTTANLAAYERWSGSELQYQSWLGDLVDEVFKVVLTQGNTMIIPAGWIHAVYTPVDTLVFGGNFLHTYNVSTQIKVRNIEIATQVPKKFRFPMFSRLCWYVGDKYLRDLKAHSMGIFSPRILAGIQALADFLVSEARALEQGSEQVKKEVKDQIPVDRVKDGPAMARELRWRARLAAGSSSDDESSKDVTNIFPSNGAKRKRGQSEDFTTEAPFKNFKPKVWDALSKTSEEGERRKTTGPKPTEGEEWTERWLGDVDEGQDGEEASVQSRRDVVVKVRRTGKGLERQRIERVVEDWEWKEEAGRISE
ncbi:jumonji superfamily protein [Laccaria bicolor S238N-H82]|uniref:JmjC domain-containing histone demethylation protein 1 n=1 Tax=Laccaria bicolor (strain S238N-H82 / ATCC MYA-4686) TaxID=486041 RepID=B0D233_LACBS|nr:jumonji superfamily protein [Laccaria bicolor S238N-H82]EDR11031.1 jumonji superfamily protein [Laccaria bicolor S238N-H82]|eukprot:XP_001878332.1 jumonji superfamily protein [Laccaria bicolor S238N-H82]